VRKRGCYRNKCLGCHPKALKCAKKGRKQFRMGRMDGKEFQVELEQGQSRIARHIAL
jgi:hypothetical protein